MVVCISLLALSYSPIVVIGADWKMEEDSDFLTAGHEADGVDLFEDQLILGREVMSHLQKDWTGGPGQDEGPDATRYLSASGLDGSSAGLLTLDKESWTPFSDGPNTRREHVAVWDDVRAQMVVLGGARQDDDLDDVWVFDPSTDTWTQIGSASTGRYWHSGSWAKQKKEVIIHGGLSYTGATAKTLNDTWTFDPGSETWGQVRDGPNKRYSHSSVWDPVGQKVLIFGGYAAGDVSKETWAYEPFGDTWEQKRSASIGLYEHSAVWADSLGLMLVYGGLKSGAHVSKDLWAYDPETDSWTQLKNGGTPRSSHAAVWDDENDWMIVVGGHEGQTKHNDTWIYESDTDTWRRGKDLPGAGRTGLSMAWDPDNDMALVYGGKIGTDETAEVWGFSPLYAKSGAVVSSAFDISSAADLVNITWKESRSEAGCTGGSIRFQLATSDTLTASDFTFMGPEGTLSYYDNGETLDRGLKGKKYIRYKAFLSSSDRRCAAVLEEVRINYLNYVQAGNYTSQAYDTGSNSPNWIQLEYEYDNPSSTDIAVFLRSSHLEDMSSASDWEEVKAKDTSFTTPQRRYIQFRVQMESEDPGKTPTLDKVSLLYNSVPQLLTSPVEPVTGGTDTEFVYRVMYKDGDGETPVVHKVVIDGKTFDMEPEGYDYVNGANFTYKTKLKSGAHTFSFEFSDGINVTRAPQDGGFDGPVVNDPPVSTLKAPKKAEKGQKVKFDASASSDPDGSVAQYKFDFGDGTDSGWQNESTAKHTYKKTGKFAVKVHVRDDLGEESVSAETEVKVEEASGAIPWPGAFVSWLALLVACLVASRDRRSRR